MDRIQSKSNPLAFILVDSLSKSSPNPIRLRSYWWTRYPNPVQIQSACVHTGGLAIQIQSKSNPSPIVWTHLKVRRYNHWAIDPLHMTSKRPSWGTCCLTERRIDESSIVHEHFYFMFINYSICIDYFALMNGGTLTLFPKMAVLTSWARGLFLVHS